jgi:hypothetical protein
VAKNGTSGNYSKTPPVITEDQDADVEVVGPPTHSITSPVYVGQNPPNPRPDKDLREAGKPRDAVGFIPGGR